MGTWDHLKIFERANSSRQLSVRIYAAVPLSTWEALKARVEQQGRGGKYLKIGALKAFVDGSLGSHTALMFEPYSDSKDNDTGFFTTPPDDIYNWAKSADEAGLHLCIHAIGDRANSFLIGVYENISQIFGNEKDRRWRIEHAQHVREQDVASFARLKIIASMQPYHAIDDGSWAENLVGSHRIRDCYRFKSLRNFIFNESGNQSNDQKAQSIVAFGSDFFVAPPIPLWGIYAAVTRSTLTGEHPEGWIPEEKLTIEESLKSYTKHAAFAEFSEHEKGILKEGYLADLVILEKNVFELEDPHQIWNVTVQYTILGGKIVYQKADNIQQS